jgi:hypothetical protein
MSTDCAFGVERLRGFCSNKHGIDKTNGRGAIENLTLEELARLDAGKGERIPTPSD